MKNLLTLLLLLIASPSFAHARVVKVIGHRGTIVHAPENTIPAFKKAIELGADYVEMDIRETRDGELVVIHDATLNRTTDGTGVVSARTLAEIRRLDAGSWFGSEWRGTRVPTLSEVLQAIGGKVLPDIDHKGASIEKIRKALLNAGLLGATPIPFFSSWADCRKARTMDPSFHVRPDVRLPVSLQMLITQVDPQIVSFQWAMFTPAFVREIQANRRKAWVQILGHSDVLGRTRRAVDAGIDYIQTDHLEIVVPYLRSRGLHH